MARAADGTMTLSGTFAIANAIPVSSTINGYISDITTEITDSWSRSGKGAALAHLSMGSFKLTLLADGVALTDASNIKQVQNSTIAWADGGGTADAITATYSPAVTAVVDGMRLRVRATAANATATPTFSPNGLTARTIKKLNGAALVAGDIAGDEHDLHLVYVATGTYWNLLNPANLAISGVAVSATSLAASTTLTLTGDLTPAQITSDQNDYAPTGHASAFTFRLSTDTTRSVTGLAGGAAGRIAIIQNVGGSRLSLPHESGSSSAANRFSCPNSATVSLRPGASATIRYDGTLSRWAVISIAVAAADNGDMETATLTFAYVQPSVQHNHPGHPKFWVYATVSAGTPTVQASYNVTSITDTGTGILTVTIATDFSDANWCCQATSSSTSVDGSTARYVSEDSDLRTAGVCVLVCVDAGAAIEDPVAWNVMGLGDQ